MAIKSGKSVIIIVCCILIVLLIQKNYSLKSEILYINKLNSYYEDFYQFRSIRSSLNIYPQNGNIGDTISISPSIQIDFWEGIDSIESIPTVYYFESNGESFYIIDSMRCYTNQYFDYVLDCSHDFLHGYMKIPVRNSISPLTLPFTISLTEFTADSIFEIESTKFNNFIYNTK